MIASVHPLELGLIRRYVMLFTSIVLLKSEQAQGYN